MLENAKKVLNVGNVSTKEYEFWLNTYRNRALDKCNARLEENVNEMFNVIFNPDNIKMNDIQDNYLLCTFASIISKLTTKSSSYDYDTITSIRELLRLYLEYYAKLRTDYAYDLDELQFATYTVAAIDSIVRPASFNTKQDVNNLYDFSKLLTTRKVESFRFDDEYDQSLNKSLDAIAKNPTGNDIFAFGIRRHDKLFNLLEGQYNQDQEYVSKKM